MRIAIIGAGNIGGTLARKWSAAGHEVRVGVRDPAASRARELVTNAENAVDVQSMSAAVTGAELVLFAIPGAAMAETIHSLAGQLAGKTIIDAANNLTPGSPTHSLGEFTADVPSGTVFRAFNTLGWENFANPTVGETQADLFYCGPVGDAQQKVETLIQAVGLRPVYVGGADRVAVVDGVASLWYALVFGQKRPRHLAFKMLAD